MKMKTMECDEQIAEGAEHRVYRAGNTVIKAPTGFGGLWHNMSARRAQADQDLLNLYQIPHLPTEIIPGPIVLRLQDGTKDEVDYVMQQPFLEDTVTLDVPMLEDDLEIRAQFVDMVERAERMFREVNLGADFIGGEGIKELFRSFTKWRVKATLHNVLIPQKDRLNEKGKLVAKAGKPILCDTRLYDCTGSQLKPLVTLRRNIQLLQNELIDIFLRYKAHTKRPRSIDVEAFNIRLAALGIFGWVAFRLDEGSGKT